MFVSSAIAQSAGAAASPQGGNMIISMIPILLIFVMFYFLLVRPQQQQAKKRKAVLAALKKGDHVRTNGGIIGTVVNLTPEILTLQVADSVRIKVVRSYIEGLESETEEKK